VRSALVTGATGFLGRYLCRELVDDGWAVTAACRDSSDRSPLEDLDVSWAVADVLDEDAVRDAVAGQECVFHLAGLGLLDAEAERVRRVNVEGTRNVLSAVDDADVERLLFTSTAGTRWRVDRPATESDLAEPLGAYQESKARAETLVDEFASAGGDAVTVHPTSVFGPGDEAFTARLLSLATDPKMVAALPGGASIVDVRDAVRGTVAAMTEGRTGEHYILGGENLTYVAALEILAHVSGGSAPRFRVPATAIRAAGPAVGTVNGLVGTRMFPVDGAMAELATRTLFYSSAKAAADLGYEYGGLRSHAHDAIEWYLETADAA
jgi:dihydroflavonol-4-reductase